MAQLLKISLQMQERRGSDPWPWKVPCAWEQLSQCATATESESEVAQSCPALCGHSVHGIFQARVLGGLPLPSLGDLPDPGIEPGFPALQADALPSEPPGKPVVERPGAATPEAQVPRACVLQQEKPAQHNWRGARAATEDPARPK